MLASNTCRGSTTSVRATHATFQMENCPSPVSIRPMFPGLNASGYVNATVRIAAPASTARNSHAVWWVG